MTTQELKNRVFMNKTSSYGHYKIIIIYRGIVYTCITTNSMAYDRYDDDQAPRGIQKDALKSLWNECKRKNNLY
jgi:hypothetical protein